jgi:hypothetical protein
MRRSSPPLPPLSRGVLWPWLLTRGFIGPQLALAGPVWSRTFPIQERRFRGDHLKWKSIAELDSICGSLEFVLPGFSMVLFS